MQTQTHHLEKQDDSISKCCPECCRLGVVSHLAWIQLNFEEAILICMSENVSFCVKYAGFLEVALSVCG